MLLRLLQAFAAEGKQSRRDLIPIWETMTEAAFSPYLTHCNRDIGYCIISERSGRAVSNAQLFF
ncbi:MAG TPA: hypothetical protein VJ770_02715 [Stellaceae bacterium]|nr:hypothetical protein [Stellaceae bacterium]